MLGVGERKEGRKLGRGSCGGGRLELGRHWRAREAEEEERSSR